MPLYGQESCQWSQQLQVLDAVDIDFRAEGRASRVIVRLWDPDLRKRTRLRVRPPKEPDSEHGTPGTALPDKVLGG